MVIRQKGLLAGVVVFAIAIAAFMLIDTNGNNLDAAQTERAGLEVPVPTRAGLANSADKVRLTVAEGAAAMAGKMGDFVLTLNIQPGWHVNANPASMEFLIPTVVSSSVNGQALIIPTQYPRGRVSDIVLSDTALEVYDDGASIRLRPDEKQTAVLEKAGRLEMIVRVQACSDEGICLAPTDLPVALNLDDTKRQ